MTSTFHKVVALTSIDTSPEARAARWLLSAEAVRHQATSIMRACENDALEHFAYDKDQLSATTDYVIATIRENYPDLKIPPHARWRHFVIAGHDRWRDIAANLADDPLETARIRFDLAITSVLLDAGAGEHWHYKDHDGTSLNRSEGLAIASLDMFVAGHFSNHADQPLRADGQALQNLSDADLASAFQVSKDNPLTGLSGRTGLINQLGRAIAARPDVYGASPRIGHLVDYLVSRAREGRFSAPRLLQIILETLGSIWPGRQSLAGYNLGDCWSHPAAIRDDATAGLVPFHKLSQWLTYSLIEPLQELGLIIDDLDSLTGLAEYRNGGLMIDCGLLRPKHQQILGIIHQPDSPIIVEWRALTVALLDRIADHIRDSLQLTSAALPLAAVLEGGTWAAGRRIAATKRANATPPLNIISDGSVF